MTTDTERAQVGEGADGVPACVGIDAALALPGVERLREWAGIGPVQRAAVEAFAAGVAPRDEAEKLDALRQTLEIIAVGDSHHPKADADAALRATGFWRAATPGVAPSQAPSDGFNGDTPHLINCMRALVNLNDAGALVPHGIGGHARTLLLAAAARLERALGAMASDDAQPKGGA